MKKAISLLIMLFGMSCYSQITVLDSLVTVAGELESDSLKIDKLHKDFFKYVYSKPEIARSISEYTIVHTSIKETPFQKAQSLIRKGIYFDVISKKDSALILYDQAFQIASPRKDYISMGNVYNDKGLVYWNRDELELAMEQYIKGAVVFEKADNDNGLSSIYNNMGLILYDLKRYKESRESHSKALKIRERLKDTYGLGASYSNLANVFKRLEQKDSAQYYMRKAVEIKKQSNDKRGLAIAYQNLGIDFREYRVLDSAIFFNLKAKDLFEEIGNKRLQANSLITLAEMYHLDGQFKKGIENVKKGISLMDKDEYKRLAEMEVVYARLLASDGDHKESAKAYARSIKYRDSYEEIERTAQAQEYYEKYQSAQKEQEIAEQRARLAENELEIEKVNRTIYALIAGAILLAILGFFFYRQQQIKNEQKIKENELQLALARIETQNKLQEQRLRISRDLHDNIGSQLTFLISSIDNLKFAQNVDRETSNNKLASLSNFTRNTMGELRDTIWAMNKKEISLHDIEERIVSMIATLNTALEGKTKILVDLDVQLNPVFNAVQGMHIFRIIQESLNNAVKYAKASKIAIKANLLEDRLQLTIEDDGAGFDLGNYPAGNGIKNLKERAAMLHAGFSIESKINRGTTISLTLNNHFFAS